ncbi:vacuolar protein sorting-associated protein 53 homolog [Macrosteles quadrilineatus]|uniref:vacuolar protein sorting-associated protein 53 homolog n=1 Tax=Macrosteles quadrilineatus TaxID=74068 RepID=UPI0023E349F2|nr:vacuolar protein sorting-associated protein 53 homolog [Macrosteles quadrilineatus]
MASSSNSANDDEEFFDEASSTLHIPQEVMKAIDQVIPSNDPLDDPDFNSIDYINSLFPTEQSLSNIDDVIAQLECKIHGIDDQIRTVVRRQTNVGKDGRDALLDAQQVIKQLFLQTLEIKSKAEQSEETVKEITRDIKQLDCAKRNLTAAITTLNHLHMLVGGVDTLKILTGKRQYGEIVMPLQGIVEVMKHFHNYTDIPQIKKLADEVHEIQNALSQQITQDFHEALTGANAKNFTPTRSLAEACLVVDILDPKVKRELLKWFVGIQLDEYLVLFNESEENAWLDKIDRRYTWFKKHLLQCEDKFGAMFPPHWEVSERITIKFCLITRAELTKIMSKRAKEIDVKLLLYAIQRTSSLEQLLAVRFTGNTLLEDNPTTQSSKTEDQKTTKRKSTSNPFDVENQEEEGQPKPTNEQAVSAFHNIIGQCFLPYLYIYIDSLDRNLYELLEKFMTESKRDFSNEQPVSAAVQGVLPSCADLFVFYKKFLVQCNQLSNGPPMLSLSQTFEKYLREYAVKILQNNLPNLESTQNPNSFTASSSIPCLKVHVMACVLSLLILRRFNRNHSLASFNRKAASVRRSFRLLCLVKKLTFEDTFCLLYSKMRLELQQLLLDTHMLKTVLLDLPSIGSQVARKAPASYTKVVVKGMTRGEMILKVVMAPIEPDTAFVDQFLKLLPESDIQEFQKVLEMKGLKAAEKNHLLSIFRPRHSSGFVNGSTSTNSPKHDTSSIRKLNNLIKKNFVAGNGE